MLRDKIYDFTNKIKKQFRTNDPYRLAKYLGIDVAYKHFGNLKGMYTIVNKCCYIFLHDEFYVGMLAFQVLSHEVVWGLDY